MTPRRLSECDDIIKDIMESIRSREFECESEERRLQFLGDIMTFIIFDLNSEGECAVSNLEHVSFYQKCIEEVLEDLTDSEEEAELILGSILKTISRDFCAPRVGVREDVLKKKGRPLPKGVIDVEEIINESRKF